MRRVSDVKHDNAYVQVKVRYFNLNKKKEEKDFYFLNTT